MPTRRHFLLRQLPTAAISIGLLPTLLAAETPISENDPATQKLHYRANADALKAGELPGFEPDQRCMRCGLFSRVDGTPYGRCEVLGQRMVAENGWCSAFVPAM
jgi:hypothetical protein